MPRLHPQANYLDTIAPDVCVICGAKGEHEHLLNIRTEEMEPVCEDCQRELPQDTEC